ncbi:MAG: hypothetical protein RL141_337 [Candidatus Parcubacteria bacterium]|jgi:MoaA/NifB/PqqE/SkfB family radical SAM enzyme
MSRIPFSTDYWYARITNDGERENESLDNAMQSALKQEVPQMCSVTMERACNLQCAHCIYPPEGSSAALSKKADLPKLILRAVEQLPGDTPRLLHEGRIIRWWHVDALHAARQARRDLRIGLIDNGTYLRVMDRFKHHNFVLDWLDLSLDGPEAVHNAQRGSSTAYRDTMQGFARARKVTKHPKDGGRVTALFTLTRMNHTSLCEVAQILFGSPDPLADQLHITTLSPARREIEQMEQINLSAFWNQARHVFNQYGYSSDGNQRIFFRLYRHQEIEKLAHVVGAHAFYQSFTETARFSPGEVYFTLQDVPLVFSPLSLWPGETFLIDADGTFRTAYSISRSLSSLRKGRGDDGEDLRGFSVEQLTPGFDLVALHRRCVDQWWSFRGKRYLAEEVEIFRKLQTDK